MCLAPCFAGCSKEEYDVEVQRFLEFLESSGESLRKWIESERERASEDMDYERAAALHKKVEKLDEVLRGRPELARRIQALDAVILQRGAANRWSRLTACSAGSWGSRFFCRLGRSPASRVRRNIFFGIIWSRMRHNWRLDLRAKRLLL